MVRSGRRGREGPVSRAWRSLLLAYIALGTWVSDHIVAPWTGLWEEFWKSIVRGCIATSERWLNTISGWLLALFPGARREVRSRTRAHTEAWRAWLKGATGTFNALLEQEGLTPASRVGERSDDVDEAASGTSDRQGAGYARQRRQRRRWIRRWLGHWYSTDADGVDGASTVKPATRPATLPNGLPPPDRHPASLARGSVLFDLPSGYAISSIVSRRGLVEDLRFKAEAGLGRLFAAIRAGVDRVLAPGRQRPGSAAASDRCQRTSSNLHRESGASEPVPYFPPSLLPARWEDAHVWTASDFVLRAGYPLEEHCVTTVDGYVLCLHRIPRPSGKDVVLFQHGVLDTSLGWVANGAIGSQAFAAYDAGFDVWLGNTRSNAPRINADPARQGMRYWAYSANEQAMADVAAQVDHIHAIKLAELDGGAESGSGKGADDVEETGDAEPAFDTTHFGACSFSVLRKQSADDDDNNKVTVTGDALATPINSAAASAGTTASPTNKQEPPYRLQAVGHSLGAACLLIYCTMCCVQGRPHRLRRLVLMSPAGFHQHVPSALKACKYLLPWAAAAMDRLVPGRGAGLRLPSYLLRHVIFSLTLDLRHLPALQSLIRRSMQALMSGDASEWDLAMQMPHYNATSMPALSLHTGAHFAQWSRDPRFRLYDHGSAEANTAVYGTPEPPSIAEHYRLLDIPVDLVAGTADRVVTPDDVRLHARWLAAARGSVTYREFNVGHMDLTFAVKPDLRNYVLQRLGRPLPCT